MHLGCFQCFLPLFNQFRRCKILGTLQAFSPVVRLIKGIRTVCVCVWGSGGSLLVYLLPSHSKDFGMKHTTHTAVLPLSFPTHAFWFQFSSAPSFCTRFTFKTGSSKTAVWPHPVHTNTAIYRSISLALFALWGHWLDSAAKYIRRYKWAEKNSKGKAIFLPHKRLLHLIYTYLSRFRSALLVRSP